MRVSPTKGVMQFGKKGKLSPKLIGPYPILERIGEVTYRLELLAGLDKIRNVFHVSQLRRHIRDSIHILDIETIELDESMTFEETSVKILRSKIGKTRNQKVKQVKILWSNNKIHLR